MNKGDTTKIYLRIKCDGEAITQGQFDEIEFTLGQFRFTLTGGDIVWNASEGCYYVSISQSQSFAFDNTMQYQIRVLDGDDCVSTSIGQIRIGDVLSKTVLAGE